MLNKTVKILLGSGALLLLLWVGLLAFSSFSIDSSAEQQQPLKPPHKQVNNVKQTFIAERDTLLIFPTLSALHSQEEGISRAQEPMEEAVTGDFTIAE